MAGRRDRSRASDPAPRHRRCLAVHPDTPRGPLLAVGLEVEGKERRGYVACIPLEP